MVNVPTAEMSDFADYIPYRRAPRLAYRLHRPLGRVRRASKGILHTNVEYTWLGTTAILSSFKFPGTSGCRMLPFAVCPEAQTLQRDGTTASGVLSAAPTQQSTSFWRRLNWRGSDFGYLFAS